jgi:hypothetical protein
MDGSAGERNGAESRPSETLLEAALTTLDTGEPRQPRHHRADTAGVDIGTGGVASTLRSLRALADVKGKEKPQKADSDGRTLADTPTRSTAGGGRCQVRSVLERTRPFDRLTHVGPAHDRRLGTVRRARVVEAGDTYRTDVCAFARPDEPGSDAFEEQLCTQLERWADAGSIDGVVPVFANGRSDGTPWAATAAVEPAVRKRDDSLGLSLFHACRLSAALANLHDRGIVHAGIDPRNVVYPRADDGRPAPAFHNVGVVDVYRRHTDPARVLDPRYAAPEYFDQSYGVVDRTTDIYQLGAVVITLLTGRPPVDGTPEEIRAATLEGDLPRVAASDNRLPEEVDEILGRATATDPFERYDTADEFRRDLTSLCGRLLE